MQVTFKEELLEHLKNLVFFLEFQGANPFKIRAFRNASDVLSGLSNDALINQVKDGSLTELEGIGKGVLAVAKSYLKSGTSDEFTEARGDLPQSLIELREIRGLGPKKIKALYEGLQIKSLGELEYAIYEHRLKNLKGFGEKIQAKVRAEIEAMKLNRGKSLLSDALILADDFIAIAASKKLQLVSVGELARKLEIVERYEFLTAAKSLQTAAESFESLPLKDLKVLKDESAISAKDKRGQTLKIFVRPKKAFAIECLRLSSSGVHFNSLVARAKKMHVDLESQEFASDQEIYNALQLPFYPAESREEAVQDSMQWKPLGVSQLTGVFHVHTTASDGLNTLDEMAEAAAKRGWTYMGLSDHSKTAFYAQGLDERSLENQWKETTKIEKKLKGLRILRGVESDILKDGSLDYSPTTLRSFDFVIASIHSRYGMTEMTDRLIAAIENKYTSMIGHISGRLLLARDAYSFDAKKVIDAAIANNRVIELNANPQRLDLDWRLLRNACERGLLISINPDAHSISGLDDVKFGVWMANKALVPHEQIINTWPLKRLESFLASQK